MVSHWATMNNEEKEWVGGRSGGVRVGVGLRRGEERADNERAQVL